MASSCSARSGAWSQDIGDACGVLGRQGGDRAHGVDAVGSHGLDVGLDPGASAGIAPSDRQCCFHQKTPFSALKFCSATPGGAPEVPRRRSKVRSVRDSLTAIPHCAPLLLLSPPRGARRGPRIEKIKNENAPRPVEEKKRFGGSACASADLLPPTGDGWLSLAAVRAAETPGPVWGKTLPSPGEVGVYPFCASFSLPLAGG